MLSLKFRYKEVHFEFCPRLTPLELKRPLVSYVLCICQRLGLGQTFDGVLRR